MRFIFFVACICLGGLGVTRIPHSLDKALTNQGMMFDEFDSLSLSLSLSLSGGDGVHSGRGILAPRPELSPEQRLFKKHSPTA